jgi:hypothetical protein
MKKILITILLLICPTLVIAEKISDEQLGLAAQAIGISQEEMGHIAAAYVWKHKKKTPNDVESYGQFTYRMILKDIKETVEEYDRYVIRTQAPKPDAMFAVEDPAFCGDRKINQESEECDDNNLNRQTCADFGMEGQLKCKNSDCTLDKSECFVPPVAEEEEIVNEEVNP